MSSSRGLRNCNPGNIRISSVKYQGEVSSSQDSAFKQFKSMDWGYRAMFVLLDSYRRNGYNTIAKAINRYAPAIENNTISYVNSVATQSGIDANRLLDTNNKAEMVAIVSAMSKVENGVPAATADVMAGWALYLTHKA